MHRLSFKTISCFSLAAAFFVPELALAQGAAASLVQAILDELVNPFILLLMAVALAIFFWGVFWAIQGKTEDMKSRGKQIMTWGLIGLFIMFSTYAIIEIIIDFVGADEQFNFDATDATYDIVVPDITQNN